MIQGFYWNVTPGGVWYDTLKSRAAQLKRAGITSVYYPPVYKGNAGNSDVGYTPYDWYDLGEYDSRGGNISSGNGSDIPTRYGTYAKLQASINEFHTQGMQVIADIVFNHRQGGLLENIGGTAIGVGGNCPPAPGNNTQSYTAFPLTYGSGRIAKGVNQGGNQWYFPNSAVNASNTFDFCSQSQYGYFRFYTNDFGNDVAQHDGNGNELPIGDSLRQWGVWFTNRLGLDGYRIDNAKGIHPSWLTQWGNYRSMANKFMVAEIYDGDYGRLQDWLSRMSGRPNTSVFDFDLRFNGIKQMCDNGLWDLRNLHNVGLYNHGTTPTQIVTFVDNHDFDRRDWEGNTNYPGHDPVVNNKKLGYAYILLHQGYPCIWWHDYFTYGVRDDINKLLALRRWARGNQDYPTNYGNAVAGPGGDITKIYVMRRYGPAGSSPDTTGLLLVLNTRNSENSVWVTANSWANKTLKDITGTYADLLTVAADSRVLLKAPAYGYAVWVPDNFPSPFVTNLIAARIDIPSTVLATQVIPRATFVNASTLSRTSVLTTMTIAIGSTPVYSQTQTIANFPAGDSVAVSYPVFTTTNNTTYTVTATIAPIPGTPSGDDQIQSTFTTSFPPVPTIDGDLSDAQYRVLATKQNSNAGFGSAIDVTKIVYYPDIVNSQLYLGVVGKVPTNNRDGIGLWLNFSEPAGSPAGTTLGGAPFGIGGHYMSADSSRFKADFEVDYMFALQSDATLTNLYVDAVKRVGGVATAYLGNPGQSGAAVTGPPSSGTFTANSMQLAFNNDGLADHGFEIRIPFSELGISNAGTVQAFAMAVSNTAYFSDVTVPGSVALAPLANPGFNPDFGTLPGGPYHSSQSSLPVQLVSFSARSLPDGRVRLDWRTISEINNYGFYVQRRNIGPLQSWADVPASFVAGHGTTNAVHDYSFIDMSPPHGGVEYRLRQVDLDGTNHFSEPVRVNLTTHTTDEGLPTQFALHQNYPNPFNPATMIRYELPYASQVTIMLFNMLGQHVSTLVNEEQTPGFYHIRFDGTTLASGLYFYRIHARPTDGVHAQSFTDIKKFLLLK